MCRTAVLCAFLGAIRSSKLQEQSHRTWLAGSTLVSAEPKITGVTLTNSRSTHCTFDNLPLPNNHTQLKYSTDKAYSHRPTAFFIRHHLEETYNVSNHQTPFLPRIKHRPRSLRPRTVHQRSRDGFPSIKYRRGSKEEHRADHLPLLQRMLEHAVPQRRP